MRFFLSSHTVRVVKRENGKKEVYKLDKLPNQQDFFDILQNFLNYLNQKPIVDNGKQNTIQVNQIAKYRTKTLRIEETQIVLDLGR